MFGSSHSTGRVHAAYSIFSVSWVRMSGGDSKEDAHFFGVLARAYTNEKTRENYMSRLRGLQANLKGDAEMPPSLYTILTNPDTYYPKVKEVYESLTTRKNVLTTLLALYRLDDALRSAHGEAHRVWNQRHDELSRLQSAKVRRSEPSEKQVEKYTSFEEIEAKYEDLRRAGPHKTLRESMMFVLLSIMVHLRPKRADLGATQIYKDADPRITTENYIVLRSRGASYLVMNLYKTSKYYQTVEEDLPEGLVHDLKTSLSRWPRKYVFQKADGTPMSNNTYSAFVRSTFEHYFGRATGVSLLRHIYITEKLDFDDMTLEEQAEEAKLMLHTAGLQRAYKWPKKTICPKLCAAYIAPTHRTRKVRRVYGEGAEKRGKVRIHGVKED